MIAASPVSAGIESVQRRRRRRRRGDRHRRGGRPGGRRGGARGRGEAPNEDDGGDGEAWRRTHLQRSWTEGGSPQYKPAWDRGKGEAAERPAKLRRFSRSAPGPRRRSAQGYGYHHHERLGRRDARRNRLDGHDRGPGRHVLRRAVGALADPLRHRRRGDAAGRDAARDHPRDGRAEESRRTGQPRSRQARRREDEADRAGRRRGDRRKARRALPAAHLADRLRHADEHERERGHLEPRDRDRRRADGLEEAGPPERSRQHVAVLERHVPDRDAHGRRRSDGRHASGGRAAARRARREGRAVERHRQGRPHALAGRDADDAGPGVLRIREPARPRSRPLPLRARRSVRSGDRRHRGRHRLERASRVRRARRGEDRRADEAAVPLAPEQVRRAGLARRGRVRVAARSRRSPPR